MGLFGPSPPINRDEFEWLFACFAWLDRKLGERDPSARYVPVLSLPREPEFLSARTAEQMFELVKRRAGLQDWECRLEQGDAAPPPIGAVGAVGEYSQKSTLGTFSVEGNTPVIRYTPELLQDPVGLAATFAHELAHLVIHSLGIPPGGEALEEHATDCAAVYLGFGVFQANSARHFSQFSDGEYHGWSASASGYLSESALVTALALFEARFELPDYANAELKDYLRPAHFKAQKYLAKRHPNLKTDIEAVDFSDWA